MVSGALTSTLPTLPLWDEVIYPILGRLDLAMIMVEDLFFSLPGKSVYMFMYLFIHLLLFCSFIYLFIYLFIYS